MSSPTSVITHSTCILKTKMIPCLKAKSFCCPMNLFTCLCCLWLKLSCNFWVRESYKINMTTYHNNKGAHSVEWWWGLEKCRQTAAEAIRQPMTSDHHCRTLEKNWIAEPLLLLGSLDKQICPIQKPDLQQSQEQVGN